MPKITLTFNQDSFDTDFMYDCAKKFGIKATPMIYFGEYPDYMVDIELESSDAYHLEEFCIKHKPSCKKDFWNLVER